MGRSNGVRAGRKAGIGTDAGAGSHATLTLVGGGAVLGVVVAAVSMLVRTSMCFTFLRLLCIFSLQR